jgi:hypothetical protein
MSYKRTLSFATVTIFCVLFHAPSFGAVDQSELSLSHVWMGDADLDNGGELGADHTVARVDLDWSRGRGESIGLSIGAGFHDYDFSGSSALSAVAPWGEVTDISLGMSWRRPVGSAGMLFIAPSLEFARGEGADWGDSIRAGAILSYGYRVSDTLTIGVGAGVFTGLEETSAFPVLLIDWQINDKWRVGNPFRPGPTGPAGLEIAYAVNSDWEVALGGGWRSNRFRLDENGVIPDGIGEVEGIPVFLRLSWVVNESVSLDIYGGQFLSGEVTARDSKGRKIGQDDLDSAALLGLGLSAAF